MPLRLGTRASALAQWQANWVADRLRAVGHAVELVLITTQGDESQNPASSGEVQPIGTAGTFGVFTKELQLALIEDRIDLAVHSLKDLPTDVVEGLMIAAVPERASPFDVLISRKSVELDELPEGAIIGTGSLRRRTQLLHHRPDLQMADIRGNVDTRLKKLREGQFDAIVLAEAGLNRLGLGDQITQVLPADIMLPAVGQGALGIETRSSDAVTLQAVATLNDRDTRNAVLAERELLAALAGGCLAPIGAYCSIQPDGQFLLRASVLSSDGKKRLNAAATAPAAELVRLARMVADDLLAQGAARLIESSRIAASD